MVEPCELVVLLSGSGDEVSRLAGAVPEVSFERLPASPDGAASPDEAAGSWYLTARMEDRSRAEEVARRVARMTGVRAAYVKPGGEPPR